MSPGSTSSTLSANLVSQLRDQETVAKAKVGLPYPPVSCPDVDTCRFGKIATAVIVSASHEAYACRLKITRDLIVDVALRQDGVIAGAVFVPSSPILA